MSKVSIINKSFIYVFIFLVVCFSLISVIFKRMSKHDLEPRDPSSPAESSRPVTSIITAFCIEETICRRHPSQPFYEYKRGKSFRAKLKSESKSNTRRHMAVPNIVHFTRYAGKKTFFRFHELLAVKAAQKVQVSKIYIWFDYVPFGENWMKIIEQPSNIILVHRMAETNETKPHLLSESEETVRLEAVLEFGGIGLDFDILLLQPLDQFFEFDITFGEVSNKISNSIVIAIPWSSFLVKWFVANSKAKPNTVSKTFAGFANVNKELFHVVRDLIKPGKEDLSLLYKEGNNFDWRKSVVCLKLWSKEHGVEHGERDIQAWKCPAGEIFRYIYGKPK